MKKLVILTLAILFLTGCTVTPMNEDTTTTNPPAQVQGTATVSAPAKLPDDQLQNRTATIKTEKGDIVIELFGDVAPLTVSNFIKLSQDGFYNNLTFHRREEGFVIQGGDPKGDGTGGPGYTIPAEISDKKHVRGAVATARLGDAANPTKASSGSQFYITLAETPFLDGEYTVFGVVTKGMEIADQIQVGDKILSIEIK